MICLLSILDFLICIYWLLSYINFYDYNDINESQTLCKAFSIAYLFLFTFSLLYLFCVLFHFINLTFNSIESILKPYKVLLKYISIGGAISLIEITLAMLLNQLGQSVSKLIYIYNILNIDLAYDDLFFKNWRL